MQIRLGKGGNVTSAGWQVTLCDPIWHVSFRSGVAGSTANYYIRTVYFYILCRSQVTVMIPFLIYSAV